MKYINCITFAILFLYIFTGCGKTNTITIYKDTNPLLDSTANITVGRVLDGDTFIFGIGRDSISVRVLGIDAYEIKHDARLDSQAIKSHISTDSAYTLGQMGKRFADSLLSKQTVLIVRDYKQSNFDTYNRLLRHLYYYQGSAVFDFGALMLQKKLALVDTL